MWHEYPKEKPTDEEIEYILCVSGKDENITYDHGVITDNYWENGQFWIHGIFKPHITIHAWMPLPDAYYGG